ncbi:FKBP-type peptidyl-prolyl cis-trans isomerase [Microbacterium pseudoresistens]|uniref:peptidylprolyl isomerase n=1 Tax=Microbacterium pseudoresistens TaxID=640634 RepID=A0A7Y9EW73_9MICO|nr:peptidylprolyl isomerase [Microbacterium pseudoresistens]
MRTRLISALSVVAVSTLLLAGCAGAEPDASATGTPDAQGTCLLDAPSGDASDAIGVEGEGDDVTVTVPADLDFTDDIERTVLGSGSGDDVVSGDLVSVRYRIVDATDSSVLDTSAVGDGGVLPVLLDPQAASLFVAALECQPLGSRIVMTLPSSKLGEGQNPLVVYAEATEQLSTVATGDDVAPVDGMPTVEVAADGTPSITIPDADAPTETEVAVLKQGDGPTVGAGDYVVVQYLGVKWSDGTEFDSSWSRGAPAGFSTSGVVEGFRKALEGQQVGSQVVVKMPAADAYGEKSDDNTSELAGEALVFVVDILATTPMPAA